MIFDQVFFLLVAIGSGFFSGFLSVKTNYLLVMITGKLLTSGNAQRRYIVIGIIATVLFFILYISFADLIDWRFGFLLSAIFVTCFTNGVFVAKKRFSERSLILRQVIIAMYTDKPNGDKITADAFTIASQTLDDVPPSNKEGILLLVMIFDSRFTVFFVSLFVGHYFSIKRFIEMTPTEQDKYLEAWASNKYLSLLIPALKSITSLSYFTSNLSWSKIGYDGGVLKRSYLN